MAALRARELGATVALIERDRLGGICSNDGCVPTRALAKAARLMRDASQFEKYGLTSVQPAIDFGRLMARTRQIVEDVHRKKQLRANLEQAGVQVYEQTGNAHFIDAHTLALADGTHLAAQKVVLCAGGHARRLAFQGAEHTLTHNDVWSLTHLPRSVAIVGGAATGCQLASVFAAFGSQTTVLDIAPRLLPGSDETLANELAAAFIRRGIGIIAGIGGIEAVQPASQSGSTSGSWVLNYRQDEQLHALEAEAVILSVGWPGNTDTLNLTAAGVQTERGYVLVDDTFRTSVPHIFAAGDITGRIMLVQSAAHQGRLATENALPGSDREFVDHVVPYGGFTDPEYASVGLTEQQARAQHECIVTTVPYAELDRAVIDGRTLGMFKLIVERASRQVLGAHVVGEQAVEIVQIVAAIMAGRMTVEQVAEMKLSYPTFTAIVGVAARQVVRELGVIPLAPYWRDLRRVRIAEWERSKAQQSS